MELRSTKTVTPLLVLGYNRPDKLIQLLKSIGSNPPEVLVVALDGPLKNDASDELKVAQCIELVKSENWSPTVVTRFRTEHLGLRRAVTDAVTWTMNEYGRAIIVEDDVILGPQFLEYMTYMLDRHEKDIDVAQINGYNEVPHSFFTPLISASRYSKYPTSCAWATWKSRWERYDDSLTWGKAVSIKNLSVQVGSIIGAMKWKINFNDAAKSRVDSWAIRWVSTIWAHNWVTIYPNRNLVFHDGRTGGTHTRTQPKWEELQVFQLDNSFWLGETLSPGSVSESNRWLQTKVFQETFFGVIRGLIFAWIIKLGKFKNRIIL
jgi:hypothetical protein